MIAPDDRPKSWSGGKIRRRRLFLRAERAALEQVLFAPWLADALGDARSVRAECNPAALSILSSAFPSVRFAAAGSLTPADLIEDCTQICANLADLVAAYPKKLAGGWLPVDQASAASQRAALLANEARRIVALAWQPTGSSQNGLEQFAPLLESAGIIWVALPMGGMPAPLAQLLSAPGCPVRHDPAWTREGLESVADLLASIDLLISTEDLAATLAGAVGKPVWKIAGPNPHWSWGAESATSKWHPTARIFRAIQGMEHVMSHIRVELEHDAGA